MELACVSYVLAYVSTTGTMASAICNFSEQLFSVVGKRILVTGASSGLVILHIH